MAGLSDSERVPWKDKLKAMGNDLSALGKTTEHAFLSVGNKLTDFYDRAREISAFSSAVVNSFSGNEVAGAIQGLQGLLARSADLMARTEGEVNRNALELRDILGITENIHKPILDFRKIVKTLGILSISTKIESAQLKGDGHDFVTIADDVEKLSVLINSSSTDIAAKASNLSALVRHTLSGVLALEARQKENVSSILGRTHTTLAALIEKNSSSATTAHRISEELQAIIGSIGEVVSSIQFHDITRQQVEHVKEALDIAAERIGGPLEVGKAGQENGHAMRMAMEARTVCELQRAQLIDSRGQFVGAAGNIIDNLRTLASTIEGMYGHVENLAGVEGETSSSFFSMIEAEMSAAITFFQEIGNAIHGLSNAVEGLGNTVGDMSRFMDEIEEIGLDIELIAINARIKAARTGEEGAPLGVIAQAIQKLSVDARSCKAAVSDELKHIVSTVEGLSRRANASFGDQVSETNGLLGDLNSLLGGLRGANKTALSLLASIEKEGKKLAKDIESAAAGITVQHEFAGRIDDAVGVLDSIMLQSKALHPKAGDSDNLETLKDLERNYTMHSERSIHESFSKTNRTGSRIRPPIPPAVKNEDHFARNVELF